MRANELDIHNPDPVRHCNDEPIVIAFDVEHHAPILEDAGVAVLRLDIRRLLPGRARSFVVPRLERLLRLTPLLPKATLRQTERPDPEI